MRLEIGAATFATVSKPPADLDARLLATTGLSRAEVAVMLMGGSSAGIAARALYPFLPEDNRPALAELAEMIGRAGTAAVSKDIAVKLYGVKPKPKEHVPPAVEEPEAEA